MPDPPKDEAVSPIHVNLFDLPAKISDPKVDYEKSLRPFIVEDKRKEADLLIRTLKETSNAFNSALESTAVSEEGFLTALKDYVGALLALIDDTGAGAELDAALAGAAAAKFDADAPVETSTPAPAPIKPLSGKAPLRYAVTFSWKQVIYGGDKDGTSKAEVSDAAFELSSVLIAAGIWSIKKANVLCESTPTGVPSGPSGQAYKLLRQAAGVFDYVARAVLPLCSNSFSQSAAPDCTAEALRAMTCCALGEAQSITVLRAIQKGNAPSLIASLSRDTRDLYRDAAATLAGQKAAANSKLAAYLQYKAIAFEAYAQIFNGIDLWKSEKSGPGLRSLKEAEASWFMLKKAASAFDKAAPSTLGKLHSRFDDELDKVLYDTMRRIEKENTIVYYQKVPDVAPPLPEGRRLAAPTAFELPEVAKAVKDVDTSAFKGLPTSAAEHDAKTQAASSKKGCCHALRCLFCCCATAAAAEATAEVVKKNEDEKDEKNKKKNEEEKLTADTGASAAPPAGAATQS